MIDFQPINTGVADRGRKIASFHPDDVDVGERKRPVKNEAVEALMASMAAIGLRTPISVAVSDDGATVTLLTGAHRVEAARRLGWQKIECITYFDAVDDVEAELWEIAENLHRAELTVLERDTQLARWITLSAERKLQSVQNAPIVTRRQDGRGHRQESGISAAARELGVDETDAKRANKVASLSDEAKQEARDLGLDDNRSALLDAAKAMTPGDQVAALQRKAAEVREFRAGLPDARKAKQIAAETGALVLAKDRRFHSGATDTELARGRDFLTVYNTLLDLAAGHFPAGDIAGICPSESRGRFMQLCTSTIDLLTSIKEQLNAQQS
jgi:hypothetical protein